MSLLNLSIKEAVNKILASPAPVLLPDTSALVDLIRVPFRAKSSKIAKNTLEAANNLATQSNNKPRNLWVVIPPPVLHEWREHSQGTLEELQRHLSKLDTMIEIAYATADAIALARPSGVTSLPQSLDIALAGVSRDFFNNAIILREDSICQQQAYTRLLNKTAPADTSGGMKDCMIIEHSLKLCSELRMKGFSQKCVFITSNTKDFCQRGSDEPQAPLDAQLASVNLSLTTNWQWTRHELGI